MGKRTWTEEEIQYLKEAYINNVKQSEIAKNLNKSISSVKSQIIKQQLTLKNPRKKNNNQYHAIYQEYDWCFQKYIVEGLTMEEMAKLADVKTRTIQKWCGDVHHLNMFTFKEHKILNDLQYQIVISGVLGDGHITKEKGIYIESHSIKEKDYLFWKYEQLKDCCNQEPSYYEGSKKIFSNSKEYYSNPSYRFNTREINQLKEIKELNKVQIINQLTELGICLFLLDDGNYDTAWHLCVADFTQEEIDYFINYLKTKFSLEVWQQSYDKRYLSFSANSSRTLIEWMLLLLPNNMDILQKKILCKHIPKKPNYIHIFYEDNTKIGLAQWCKNNKVKYEPIRDYLLENNIENITESKLMVILEKSKDGIYELS